ncbi:Monoacylglycerol lipase [Paenibacillus plantiphilus]|uniref:Monoacylglycerol lipase n=1 Tax=Paenibacillus plantiphilus TaxID=2905650 RepID=A0ABM9BYJ4_9BACL|nr:alpha/beta hydrolase [Paenibacillus plantiphilus]CAH1197556.1 Monoacylglycerol lipase [Paenibacillus plantiphilus]
MKCSHYKLSDDHLYVYKWEPDHAMEVIGIIQLVHGSCEHAGRYERFAHFLAAHGYVVYANDHRGHGLTATSDEELGYFGEWNGWSLMVDDLYQVTKLARQEHPHLSIVMLGHSMGSFLARHYAMRYVEELDGLILVGTAHQSRFTLHLAKIIASWEIRALGRKHRSRLLNRLSYESFNHRFQPSRTKQDWLTRSDAEVDQFIRDERCGFVFTANGFRDMFEGLLYITAQNNVNQTRADLPILLLSGGDDPVGSYGKMVKRTVSSYVKAGVTNVQMKLYDGMRHEILNEIDKEQVYNDILIWLKQVLSGNERV